MGTAIFLIWLCICLSLGFWLLGDGVYSFYRGRQALSWPTVQGFLLECGLEKTFDEALTLEVKVRYGYSVDGQVYEGKRVAFGYCGSSLFEQHHKIYEKLWPGSLIKVYYNPRNPKDSVLLPGFNRSVFWTLAFAIIWLLGTIAIVFG